MEEVLYEWLEWLFELMINEFVFGIWFLKVVIVSGGDMLLIFELLLEW